VKNSRRKFLTSVSMLAAATAFPINSFGFGELKKLRIVLVGTGIRGTSFWGRRLVQEYSDILEFVGLSDINSGRLDYAKEYIGVDCPVFTDFDKMLRKTKPDLIIVTTVDATHHKFIVKGLEFGCDVLTEKPLTTDEAKAQEIIEAERKSGKNLIVGFNYRWSPYSTKIKELLMNNAIGDITSVDFNWYLNTYHGASYFRRWHGLKDKGGSLWVHKSTHHFDLLNWWLDSDPSEVFAYGDLEHYGSNGPFKGTNCRSCQHKGNCEYYFDITKDQRLMDLYVNNEKHDGYIRDNCLWREEIDIFDKMAVQIKYANNVQVSYSLSTYSPFEGFKIAFNGKDGRLETSEGIPWRDELQEDQSKIHDKEMDHSSHSKAELKYHEIITQRNFEDYNLIKFPFVRKGHWGGDRLMFNEIFRGQVVDSKLKHAAGVREGSMAVLVGIAARISIDEQRPVKIAELTDLVPKKQS